MAKTKFSLLAIVLVLVAAIIIIAGLFLIVLPAVDEGREVQARVQEKEEQVAGMQDDIAVLKNLESDQQNNKEIVEKLNTFLPAKRDIPELLAQLENITYEEVGVGLPQVSFNEAAESQDKRMKIKDEKTSSSYKTLSVTTDVVGSYDNFKKYLRDLEENLRLISVTSLEFAARPVISDGPEDVFSYKVNFSTYYLEDDSK